MCAAHWYRKLIVWSGNLRERAGSWLESVRLSCLGAGGEEGMESEGWGGESDGMGVEAQGWE